jgi:AhpD family alkylhydroperoxidase
MASESPARRKGNAHPAHDKAGMARIPYIEAAALPEAFKNQPHRQNFQRVYANSPAGAKAYSTVSGYVRDQSALDPKLRELALLQVGHVTKCAYEFTHHVKVALAVGLTPEQIAAIPAANAGRPTGFSPLELAVLKLAAAVTAGDAIDDETFDFLGAQLGNEHLMDLLFVTAHYLGMARLLTTLRVDIEDEYRGYLDDFPLAVQA